MTTDGPCYDCVVLFDMGGDPFLSNYFLDSAAALGRTVEVCSLNPNHVTMKLNLLQLPPDQRHNLIEVASRLVEGCGIPTGFDYGESWFAVNALNAGTIAIAEARKEGRILTLQEMFNMLDRPQYREQFREAAHLRFAINLLLSYDVFDADGSDPSNEINFAEGLEKRTCYLFHLPTILDKYAKAAASQAMISLISAQAVRTDAGVSPIVSRIGTDEAAEIVCSGFGNVFCQSLKHNCPMWICTQSSQQLINRDTSLLDVVMDNTDAQLFFTSRGEDDIAMLQSMSKDTSRWYENKNFAEFRSSVGKREVREPVLDRNTILEVSATKGHAFLCRHLGEFEEPLHIEWPYPTTTARYLELFRRPLPRRPPPAPTVAAPPRRRAAPPDPAAKEERKKLLLELFDKLNRDD
jgi:hypothetical protein